MSRQLKNTIIYLFCAMMLAVIGVFFVGCGSDSSSISISADVDTVSLEVGEETTVTFTIENYSSSFSNKVEINPYFDGTATLFSVSEAEYLSDNVFTVTITAIAGGSGTLKVVTLEGSKECSVPVLVTQYSSSLAFTDELLYVSNSTNFVPTHSNFTFDVNTTEKDVSYYYVDGSGDADVSSGYSFNGITESEGGATASFVASDESEIKKVVYQFDTIMLSDGTLTFDNSGNLELLTVGTVKLVLDDEDVTYVKDVSSLLVLAVYNGKVESEEENQEVETETINGEYIYDLGTVYVLPNLNVSITGGNLYSSTLSLDETLVSGSSLVVSPNYEALSEYIVRIERENVSSTADIVTDFSLDLDSVNVQYLTSTEVEALYEIDSTLNGVDLQASDAGKNVTYLRILSSTQIEAEVSLTLTCHYEVAKNVTDESVNVTAGLLVDVKIAPTTIYVNGSSNPETITLYSHYSAPDFGWNDLLFEVISNYATSPNISGISFEYDESCVQLTQNNVNVRNGYTYSDLDTAFKVRGVSGSTPTGDEGTILTVYVECDWGEFSDVKLEIKFIVLVGVTSLNSIADGEYSSITIDMDGGTQTFCADDGTGYIFANDVFQSLSFALLSGFDVAEFSVDETEVCKEGDVSSIYYLIFSITPTSIGSGTYRIYTDNGTHIDLSIEVISVLDGASISLASSGNNGVAYYYYEDSTGEDCIERDLYVELQNEYADSVLVAGKTVKLEISGNYTSVSTAITDNNDGAFSLSQSTLIATTLGNGTATIKVTISGYAVEDFKKTDVTLFGYVHLSAYSLLSSFYLKNGDDYALSNSIYYGPDITKSVTFTPYAESTDASNFFQYQFTEAGLKTIFESALSDIPTGSGETTFSITSSNFDDYISKDMVTESYSQNYIYYYAYTSTGASWGQSTITLNFTYGSIRKSTLSVNVSIYSGLMFYISLDSGYTWTYNNSTYNVTIATDNTYSVGLNGIGTFDVSSLTYTQTTSIGENEVVISASIDQRNGSLRRYDAHIYVQNYEYADTITLNSSTSSFAFSTSSTKATVNVLVTPSSATNPSIQVEYVPDSSTNILQWTVTDNGSGSYSIELSVENFCANHESDLQNITDSLSGKLYIYPTDWGSSHSSLSLTKEVNGESVSVVVYPIEIDISFQNGAENNPYVLTSAEDVVAIGSSEAMLASHYTISTSIDMSKASSTTPLGIMSSTADGSETYSLVGFSGSITGTSSQAAITGIDLSNWNATVDNVIYAGLFAQITATGKITNVSFSGSIEGLDLTKSSEVVSESSAYVSILVAENYGTLTNVGVEVDESQISLGDSVVLYYGAAAGINYGKIVQDFTMYQTTEYVSASTYDSSVSQYYVLSDGEYVKETLSGYEDGDTLAADTYYYLASYESDYSGMQPKILAYYNDVLTITGEGSSSVIYAGGIVGANAGLLQRIESDTLSIYGTSKYSAYTLITVTGEADTVYLGGAAAISTGVNDDLLPCGEVDNFSSGNYNTIIKSETVYQKTSILNLLVGGEVSTLDMNSSVSTSCVGGIVGFFRAGASKSPYYVEISDCISRTFVRGQTYVGGIIGFDYYDNDGLGDITYTTFSNNALEAVDDGRGGLYASMIIKTAEVGGTDLEIYASIGNANVSGRDISGDPDEGDIYANNFSAISYLTRSASSGVVDTSSTTIYYGDYVVYANGKLNTQKYFDSGSVSVKTEESDFRMTYILADTYDSSVSQYYVLSDGKYDEVSLTGYEDGDSLEANTYYYVGGDEVFFMTYFSVSSDVSGEYGISAQEKIADLNVFSTTSALYPFKLANTDVSIKSSSSSVLSIDSSGTITLKSTGLAMITLSSILNINTSLTIYVYVVDYFDSTYSSSMFRTGTSTDSDQVTDNFTQNVYGNSYATVYAVPTYTLSATDYNGNSFVITEEGILYYQNVAYYLSTCTSMKVNVQEDGSGDGSTTFVVSNRSVTFKKTSTAVDGGNDSYTLIPYISVSINGQTYTKAFLDGSVDITVCYNDTATKISTKDTYVSFQTSQDFTETVTVTSTNDCDNLFYVIFDAQGNEIQSRIPSDEEFAVISSIKATAVESTDYFDENKEPVAGYDSYEEAYAAYKEACAAYKEACAAEIRENLLEYLNTYTSDDLFIITFSETDDNVFTFTCKVNKESTLYTKYYDSIFGQYTIVFYSSELLDGVSCSMTIELLEPELSNVSVGNYSSISSMSSEDEIVVPNQRGVLEITVDPYDAVFSTFTITNNSANSGTAIFALALEVESEASGVEFVVQQSFGKTSTDGTFSFTYAQLISLIESVTDAVEYYGRFYISYILPSGGLQDGDAIGFDISISYVDSYDVEETYETNIFMNVKFTSYAKLVFDDKEAIGDYYYVARGLSYSLSLEAYNFSVSDIESIELSNTEYATLTGSDGSYTLTITSGNIIYPSNKDGYLLTITTKASKIVDGIEIVSEDVLEIYIMEYVLQYSYVEGVNEDIVSGMEDGVITMEVGNTLALSLNIYDFLEYDSTISSVVSAVNTFVSDLENVTWKVIENGTETTLASGKTISSDYYTISSYIVTPTQVYDPEDDIYHFSVSGLYVIDGGTYKFTTSTTNADILYTEFSLDVHNQSTQDNPIPIYSYEELIGMEEGEWYILMNDITLASDQIATAEGIDTFSPIETEIAGLDGNGKTIYFGSTTGSTYTFTDLTDVGLFAEVSDETILQNVTVSLYNNVTFIMNVETFSVGLVAATNNGIITNCVAKMRGDYSLTVNCTTTTSSSYVAGLVGTNAGYITNSRSSVSINSTDNLSGFVAVNSGHIASSYYRGASLTNTTNTNTELTAGFVIQNSGEIYACYVSGDDGSNNTESVYYAGTDDLITSSYNAAGFVYTNSGSISDSYSNINLENTSSFVSGFVFDNTGTISNCISWSLLESNQSRCYGFAYSNSPNDDGNGIFDCSYLSDKQDEDDTTDDLNVNISEIATSDTTDVTAYALSDFANADNFETFAISSGRNINSVWFLNTTKNSTSNFNGSYFNIGRIELVAANIVATSIRELESVTSTTDPSTGATFVVYTYKYSTSSASHGSVYNPILISDAEEFEEFITNENSSSGTNSSYYRLVSDIDFSDSESNCSTHATKFVGYFEGNFMTISNVSLASGESGLSYAGLFAEVGNSSSSSAIGTIMNMTISASQVYFPSANVVGGVAGKLDGGTLINITVTGADSAEGNNIVGGVVGVAVGEYTIFNVNSTLSAISRNQNVSSNNFSSSSITNTTYSFAGSIAGVLSGSGSLYGSTTDSTISVLADKAGLMFGFVDSNVTVSSITLEVQEDDVLDAYSYVGLVVGETKGTFDNVQIIGMDGDFEGFSMAVYTPTAVGGFAGLMSGGTVTNISTTQSISISSISTESVSTYVGGLVGLVTGSSTLENVDIGSEEDSLNFVGYSYVGALIGGAQNSSGAFNVNVSKVNAYASLSALGIRQTSVGVGGLVGLSGVGSIFSIVNCQVSATIVETVTVYGLSTTLTAGAGALIGYDSSSYDHIVSNTTADVTITSNISFLSGSSTGETQSETVTLTIDEEDEIVDISDVFDGEQIIDIIKTESEETFITGSVSFTCTSGSTVQLQLNVFATFTNASTGD